MVPRPPLRSIASSRICPTAVVRTTTRSAHGVVVQDARTQLHESCCIACCRYESIFFPKFDFGRVQDVPETKKNHKTINNGTNEPRLNTVRLGPGIRILLHRVTFFVRDAFIIVHSGARAPRPLSAAIIAAVCLSSEPLLSTAPPRHGSQRIFVAVQRRDFCSRFIFTRIDRVHVRFFRRVYYTCLLRCVRRNDPASLPSPPPPARTGKCTVTETNILGEKNCSIHRTRRKMEDAYIRPV